MAEHRRFRRWAIQFRKGFYDSQPDSRPLYGNYLHLHVTRQKAAVFLKQKKESEAARTDGFRYWHGARVIPVDVVVEDHR